VVDVVFDTEFKKDFKRIKNKGIKDRIIKPVYKLKDNPESGKPMMYGRKGTRELYIVPYRLAYRIDGEKVYILALYHKDEQ